METELRLIRDHSRACEHGSPCRACLPFDANAPHGRRALRPSDATPRPGLLAKGTEPRRRRSNQPAGRLC